MKVCFVLPGPRREPVGGYAVVYRYANALKENGHEVDILYPASLEGLRGKFFGIKGALKYHLYKLLKFYSWSETASSLSHKVVSCINDVSGYDLVICTSVETAFCCSNFYDSEVNFLYFVQDFEDWYYPPELVEATYRLRMFRVITVSNYLKHLVESVGGKVYLNLPNGVEHNHFFSNKEYRSRDKDFLFMYHPSDRKGCKPLIDAIVKYKKKHPSSKFSCFSAYKKPSDFPEFIEFVSRPSRENLSKIYNSHKYFICSSIKEGFGLTPAEAMACGTVVMSTENGGVSDFLFDEETGFVIKGNSKDDFYEAMVSIEKKELSVLSAISAKGAYFVRTNLVWDNNFQKLNILIDSI